MNAAYNGNAPVPESGSNQSQSTPLRGRNVVEQELKEAKAWPKSYVIVLIGAAILAVWWFVRSSIHISYLWLLVIGVLAVALGLFALFTGMDKENKAKIASLEAELRQIDARKRSGSGFDSYYGNR